MSGNIVDVNSDNWDAEVAQSTLPVLVDFWAPWCGPCLALTPTIEAVAAEYAGQIKVVKVNCDDNKPISERFDVRGIPHLVLLKGGEPADVVAGRTRTRIVAEVETHLGRDAPRMSAAKVLEGAWGGDPARKQASIATARAALAAGPAVSYSAALWLDETGNPSSVYCAAYGTADPAELEARAGLPASTLMLAGAALEPCQYVWTENGVCANRTVVGTEGDPIEALEAIRVGADPLALARCYVVDLLGRLAALVDPNGQGLTPEQQALVRQLATLHESDRTDPAEFRAFRRAATAAMDAATGDVATTVLRFVESVAWPLAGLTDELPELVSGTFKLLRHHLSPERLSVAEQATLDALTKLYTDIGVRRDAGIDVDVEAQRAKIKTTPEYAAVNSPAFMARMEYYDRVAAEAYGPFAVDLLIGAFRKA